MPDSPIPEMDRQNAPAIYRQWRVERAGQVLMALVVVAALLGVFSEGPLSSARASDGANKISVSYERFDRRGGSGALRLRISPQDPSASTVKAFLGDDLLDHYTIDAINPTPKSVTAVEDGKLYEFEVAGADPVDVDFAVTAQALGWESSTVGLPDGTRVHFDQFFYP